MIPILILLVLVLVAMRLNVSYHDDALDCFTGPILKQGLFETALNISVVVHGRHVHALCLYFTDEIDCFANVIRKSFHLESFFIPMISEAHERDSALQVAELLAFHSD